MGSYKSRAQYLYIPVTALTPNDISSESVSVPAGAAGTIKDFYLLKKPILTANKDWIGGDGDTSVSFSSTTFTNMVPAGTPDADLASGDYWIDHVTGRGRGKKADTGTSLSVSYSIFLDGLAAGGTIIGDLAITGNLSVTGNFSFGSVSAQLLFIGDDDYLAFGNTSGTPDVRVGWNTAQTVDALYVGLADAQNNIIFAENGDRAFDFAHGASINPHVIIHSAAQSATQYISFQHNQTDALITVGAGDLLLNVAGGNVTPSASDGWALGSATLMVSDVFLASGAVVNFNNGNVTLTHAAGVLSLAGGDFKVANDLNVVFGTTNAAGTATIMQYDTAETVDAFKIGVDETSRRIMIMDYGDIGTDTALAAETDPTLSIFAATYAAAKRISINHNGTIAKIKSFTGGVSIVESGDTGINVLPNGALQLVGSASSLYALQNNADSTGIALYPHVTTTSASPALSFFNNPFGTSFSASTAVTQTFASFAVSINQTGSAIYEALKVNVTEVTTGGTTNTLAKLQVGGVTRWQVGSMGRVTQTPLVTLASSASQTLDAYNLAASTITITGTTQITTATGFNYFSIGVPTYTDSSAVTIDRGATFYVAGPPVAAGSVTLTAPYVAWFDAGNFRVDGNILLGTTVTGASAANGVLALGNGATGPTTSVDMVHLYALDASAGNATLAIFTETSVVVDAALVSTHSLTIWANLAGTMTKYKVPLITA